MLQPLRETFSVGEGREGIPMTYLEWGHLIDPKRYKMNANINTHTNEDKFLFFLIIFYSFVFKRKQSPEQDRNLKP